MLGASAGLGLGRRLETKEMHMQRIGTVLPAVAGLVMAAFSASGQVVPLKPGLWQVQVDMETDGKKRPDVADRLKNMPPERRAQVEAMMKSQGVDAAGATNKVCQTAEMMDAKNFLNTQRCQVTYGSRTNSMWKSHTSCPQDHVESDTEVVFVNRENYTVKSVSTVESGGKSHVTHRTMTGKWVSADCGDVKPFPMGH